MTSPETLRRRVDALEAEQVAETTGAIVIYEVTDTEEERLARVPPGAVNVIFIPNNHRDDQPET